MNSFFLSNRLSAESAAQFFPPFKTLMLIIYYHKIGLFAIIFHRPFIVFDREQNITSMSSRIDNLLDIFELNKRRFSGNFLDDVFVTDYEKADSILVEERKKMYSYISECLH